MLLHNIHALHGSPAAQSKLRRVLYYEFRPIDVEMQVGPHTLEYIPLKQDMLRRCIKVRQEQAYAKGETPYVYRGSEPALAQAVSNKTSSSPFRVPHEDFWRDGRKDWTI